MQTQIATPKDFFLEKSSFKKHAYQYTRTGYRKDIDMNVRSSWEANFVRILKLYKIDFKFEPTVFPFPIKRGTRAYTPDFLLTRNNEWIEIKGYLDDKSKLKLKRFKRYYPDEFVNLTCVIGKYSTDAKNFMNELEVPVVIYYEDIRDIYGDYFINWEGKK